MKKLILLLIGMYSISSFGQKNNLNLMPWPQEITIGTEKFVIEPNFTILIKGEFTERIQKNTTLFLRRLSGRTGVFLKNGFAFKTIFLLCSKPVA